MIFEFFIHKGDQGTQVVYIPLGMKNQKSFFVFEIGASADAIIYPALKSIFISSMTKRTRKTYDKEFKIMVVNLCQSGRKASEVATEMGLDPGMVSRWVREYNRFDDNSFKGNGNPVRTSLEEENAQLRKELRQAQTERDILKKAVSIFSKSDSKNMNL